MFTPVTSFAYDCNCSYLLSVLKGQEEKGQSPTFIFSQLKTECMNAAFPKLLNILPEKYSVWVLVYVCTVDGFSQMKYYKSIFNGGSAVYF